MVERAALPRPREDGEFLLPPDGHLDQPRIDQKQERMVKLDAHLIYDVNFGWGILGRLFKGGTIVVEQKDVGDGHWETTHMALHLQGKILLLKSLDIQTTEDAHNFEPVKPQMSYQDAVHLLLSDNFGRNGGGAQTADKN